MPVMNALFRYILEIEIRQIAPNLEQMKIISFILKIPKVMILYTLGFSAMFNRKQSE